MSISFVEARHIVCQALGYNAELATTVLMTAMHNGQLSYSARPTQGGYNTIFITTGLPPSERSMVDHDQLLEFVESRRSPKRRNPEQLQLTRWPWGDYETKLLQELAAAAERFWTRYDPSDPTTAPTNEQVTAWLIERGVAADRNAEVMATILRADGLRQGPRK